MIHTSGLFGRFLRPLLETGVSLMKNLFEIGNS